MRWRKCRGCRTPIARFFYSVFFSFVFSLSLSLSLSSSFCENASKTFSHVVVSRRVGRNIPVTCVVSIVRNIVSSSSSSSSRAISKNKRPSALPRCSRHCSPILLRAAAATAHRRGAPKTMMMMMMMIHASLSHKSTLVFFLVCGTLSLSLFSSKLFGAKLHTKKKKKTETIPVRGHQNQIITYSKKSRLFNTVILFLSKNKSLPWWVGI